jgi:hypothetical protein
VLDVVRDVRHGDLQELDAPELLLGDGPATLPRARDVQDDGEHQAQDEATLEVEERAMPVRTAQLAIYDAAPATTTIDLYTCPEGHTVLLKDITVMNLTGGPRDVGVAVRRATLRGQVAWVQAMPNLAVFQTSERGVVLEPGDVLELFVGAGTGTGKVRALACGAILAGVAE